MSLIDTFSKFDSPFSYDGITHEVYWKKAGEQQQLSPAILLIAMAHWDADFRYLDNFSSTIRIRANVSRPVFHGHLML